MKTKNYPLFAALITTLLLLFSSCGEIQNDLPTTVLKKSKAQKDISYEKIEIQMNGNSMNYFDVFSIYESNGKSFYVGYDNVLHALQFIDLNNQSHLKTTELEREGPNGISNIEGLYVHNLDSIFIATNHYISLTSSQGAVLNKIDKRTTGPNMSNYYFFNRGPGSTFFDDKTNSLYTGIYDITLSEIAHPKEYFKGKLMGSLDLKTNKFRIIKDLSFPLEYISGYQGYLGNPTINHHKENDLTIISFPASKKFTLFNRLRNEFTVYSIDQHEFGIEDFSYQLNFKQTRDDDSKMKHYMLSTKYSPVIRVKENQFIRLVRKGLPLSTTDLSKINRRKKVYLINYDLNNNEYWEGELPENFLNTDLVFPINDYLYIQGFATKEGICQFIRIKLV